MRKNVAPQNTTPAPQTHEGAVARRINAEQQLRRSVLANMLWENTFYEDGESVAKRIREAVKSVKPEKVMQLAIDAREKYKLRHIPLLLVREMARLDSHKGLVAATLERIIQRPDEMGEFMAIYWENGREKVSAQVKKGLARAFVKFDEYSLAKYDRDSAGVKLRDVLCISHAKPKDVGGMKKVTKKERAKIDKGKMSMDNLRPKGYTAHEKLFQRVMSRTMKTPDTWETALSASKGEDKKKVWERLLDENKLKALALIRNLRNMEQENVSESKIRGALAKLDPERVLPYRFIAAAKYAPKYEPELETAMLKCLGEHEKLSGKTVILLDVSGSMNDLLSGKSDMNRIDAACGLAILLREVCENVAVYTFSNSTKIVPPRHGFALRDAIHKSQPHGGTRLGQAISDVNSKGEYDRLIVLTDEQSHDTVGNPSGKGYMINVANYQHGVGYGKHWTHLDGFSEAVVDWIREYESLE